MTALNFPSSPTIGQTYTANGGTWEWDGTTWVSKNILDVTLGGTGASTFTSQRLLVGQGTTAVTSSLIADNGTRVTVNAPTTLTAPNSSAAAWLTSGINLVVSPATFTDTTSSGTIGDVSINRFGAQTMAATSATTVTRLFGAYFANPAAGTNVTASNPYALGADSLRVEGTVFVAASGSGSVQLGSSTTTGQTILGGTSQTGTMTLGQSTVSQTTNIQAGATASGSTKTINIGTGGLTGSTTAITLGSTVSATSMTVNGSITSSGNIATSSATGRIALGTDSGGSISLGKQDNTASFPYIDFNTGATSVDFDARIAAAGGTGTSGNGGLTITAASTTLTGILSTPLGSVTAPSHTFTGDTNTGMWSPAADTLAFSTNGIERMRVINVGNVVINYNTTFPTALAIAPQFSVGSIANGTGGGITLGKYRNNGALGADFELTKSRSSTVGANSIGVNEDLIGTLTWSHADGTGFVQAASISANIDGIPGTNDMPGRLVFSTTADGASTPTERMRVDSSGNVGIGTSSPTASLSVVGAQTLTRGLDMGITGVDATCYVSQNRATVETIMGPSSIRMLFGTISNHDVAVQTNNTEKMRIEAGGNIGIGTSAPTSRLTITGGNAEIRDGNYLMLRPVGNGWDMRLQATGTQLDVLSGGALGSPIMSLVNGGNVGIGTSSPASLLHVKRGSNAIEVYPAGTWATRVINATDGTDENGFVVGNRWAGTGSTVFEVGSIYGGGTGSWYSYYKIDGTGQSFWSNGGTERMRLDTSGNVGIGTTAPTAKLHVQGTGYFNDDLTVNGGQVFTAATQARVKFGVWSDTTYGIGMQSGYTYGGLVNDYAMTFQFSNTNTRGFWWGDSSHTNAQGAMALTTNGKLTIAHSVRVGFGEADTTVPGSVYILDVSGAANIIGNTNIGGSGGTYQGLSIRNSDDSAVGETVNFIDARNNLGTATGSFFFHNQTDGGAYITLGNTPAGDRATDRRAERMRILANGNVGIGTTAAAQRLHVRQDQDGTTAAIIQNRNATGSPASALQFISGAFDLSDNRYAMISSTGGGSNTLQFWTAAGASPTQKMVITSAGNVGIGVASPPQLLALGNTTDQVGAGVSGAVSTLYFGSPSTGSGGIKRLAYDRATGALTFIGGGVVDPSTQMTIASGGEITAAVDFRAPIFRDSDDTARFFNGTGGINFLTGSSNRVTIYSDDSGFYVNNAEGVGGLLRLGAAYNLPGVYINPSLYLQSENTIFFRTQNVERASINSSGTFAASGDFRAPIFYDSNNTAAYIDPAGASWIKGGFQMNVPSASNDVFGGLEMREAGLVAATQTAATYAPGINFHWGSITAARLYMNSSGDFVLGGQGDITNNRRSIYFATSYAATDSRAPIFYDTNNTAYYVDPNGATSLRTTGDWRADSSAWTGEFNGKIQYHSNNWYFQGSGQWEFRRSDSANAFSVNQAGECTARSDFRAPIFYDSANTAFYIDAASTSNLNIVNVQPNSGTTGGGVNYNGAGSTFIRGTSGDGASSTVSNLQLQSWFGIGFGPSITGQTVPVGENAAWLDCRSGSFSARADFRAPIFYDQNDTTYYVDPNSGTSAVFVGDIVMGPELNMVVGARTDRYIDVKGDLYFRYSDNSSFYNTRMLIRQSGAILSFADFESSGNITAYASDRRLKTNIVPIKNALQKVLSIGGYTFDWDVDKCAQHGFTPTQVHEHGVIAQEIEEIMPDVVVHAPFDKETRPNHDMSASRSGEWFKTVNYDKIVPLLIEAIKEQQAHINNMQKEIEILKGDK